MRRAPKVNVALTVLTDRQLTAMEHELCQARQRIDALEASLEFARRRGEAMAARLREIEADTGLE